MQQLPLTRFIFIDRCSCYRESSKPLCLQEVPMKRPEIGYVMDNFINGFTNLF